MKRTITLITLIAALLVPSMALAQRMPAKANMRLSQFKKPANILLRDGEEPIMDIPEGILHDNMYASSFAYGLGWGDIYIQDVDGGIGKVVEGTDGNLYIYNPISQGYIWFTILPWIKAEPAGDGKFVVKLPQLYILDYGDPYYAYCMHYDEDEGMPVVEEEGEIEFTWQDGVLTQLGDKFIGLCDATADWFYMADQHIVYAPQTDEPIIMTEDDYYIQSYTMTYLSDPTDLSMTKECIVNVIIDGENIYIGNLNNNNPNFFIKGTLADGKATFPSRQYLGVDAYYNGHIYVLTGDAFVDTETYGSPVFNYNLNDEITFNVDEDARNIVAEWPASIITNVGPSTLYIINDYVAPGLVAFDESPAVPAAPTYEVSYDADYMYITFFCEEGELTIYDEYGQEVAGNPVVIERPEYDETADPVYVHVSAKATKDGVDSEIIYVNEMVNQKAKPEPQPDPTPTPVISYEVLDDAVVITATGEGTVTMYVDGVEVDNPYTIERGNTDVVVVVTATAQDGDQPVSEAVTMEITIPALGGVQPEDPHDAGAWVVFYDKDDNELWYEMTPGVGTPTPYYITLHLNKKIYGYPTATEWPTADFYIVIEGVQYGPEAYEALTEDEQFGYANHHELFEGEEHFAVLSGYWYTIGVIADCETGNFYMLISRAFAGVEEFNADKTVAGVRYYNMAGQEMQQADGMTIVVTTYTDGTTSTAKVIK